MTIIVTTIGTAPAVLIDDPAKNDGEVLVQNSATVINGGRILDLRPASRQQLKRIDIESGVEIEDKEEFLRALVAHATNPIKDRIRQFL